MKPTGAQTRVMFVCAGNICRSPTAEGVFRHQVAAAGLTPQIEIASAGTHSFHLGEPPDRRSMHAAAARGYDLSAQRARCFEREDFERFDYLLAMDRSNLSHLQSLRPRGFAGHLGLFLAFAPELKRSEVPDPYYGGANGFDDVLDLIEIASVRLLEALRREAAR